MKFWITLFRVSNLPTVWSNVLTAILLSGVPFLWWHLLLLLISFSFIYSAGMALNDIKDVAIDKLQRSSRPIASGRISLQAASLVTVLLFAFALILLLAMPHALLAIIVCIFLISLIILYDFHHKANPYSVFIMAGCRLMIYLLVGFAMAGALNRNLVVIAVIQFLYIILVSLTARYENQKIGGFGFPVIPLMLSGICFVDGIFLSMILAPVWLIGGVAGVLLTLAGQSFVRGD